MSKPVVAIKDESFEIVIENEKNGLFFTNEREYINLIEKLYNDKEYANKIGRKACDKAKLYSEEAYAKNVLEIYNMVIKRDTNIFNKTFHNIKKIVSKKEVDSNGKDNSM